jgi:flagellar hook-associated protein 1
MSSISQLLNTGLSALRVNQLGINVTGNNISNVNTEGYSRQRLELADNKPTGSYLGQYGTGVRAVSVDRVFDQFLRGNLISEEQTLGKYQGMEEALGLVEGVFTETEETGISPALDDFWNAWQSLASNPSGYAERSNLAAKTETLTESIQDAYGQLADVTTSLNADIDNSVTQVNQLASQIAQLNEQITRAESTGQGTADLQDSRDRLLSELSGHIDFTMESSGDAINIKLDSGDPTVPDVYLVNGSTANALSFDGTDLSLSGTVVTDGITGGRIGGMLSVKDEVSNYQGKLDTLASTMITQVNTLHSAGYSVDSASTTGLGFFTGTGASDIALNPLLAADVNKIAASGTLGDSGDNSVALAISDLATTDILGTGGTQTFGEFYSSLVQEVGNDLSKAQTFSAHESALVEQLKTQRESVSGVSLDEETVNLMKYQHGYEAAAKVISVADELLQTLMNMI